MTASSGFAGLMRGKRKDETGRGTGKKGGRRRAAGEVGTANGISPKAESTVTVPAHRLHEGFPGGPLIASWDVHDRRDPLDRPLFEWAHLNIRSMTLSDRPSFGSECIQILV